MTKKLILSSLVFVCGFLNAQNVVIPDANFKALLLADPLINTNQDSEIQVSEAGSYQGTISVRNAGISDLTGIEEFTNLSFLDCYGNNLTSLNLQQNIGLKSLNCGWNLLSSIDLENNVSLMDFRCSQNKFEKLDLSQNNSLVYFDCSFNIIEKIQFPNNQILKTIICTSNKLKNLNLYNSSQLSQLECDYNPLIMLDLSQNSKLKHLNCTNTSMQCLSVKNGNNGILSYFDARNNSSLPCIDVDNPNATNPSTWTKDASTNYRANCASCTYLVSFTMTNNCNTYTFQPNYTSPTATYSWDFNGDGIQDSNLENPSFTFVGSNTYNVRLSIVDGSYSTTYILPIVLLFEANAGPDITVCKNDVITIGTPNSPAYQYQWYLGFAPIPGATNPTFTVTVNYTISRTYTLQVFDPIDNCILIDDVTVSVYPNYYANCVGGRSLRTNEGSLNTTSVKIYPNPSSTGRFNLQTEGFESSTVQILNIYGELLSEFPMNSNQSTVDISDFAKGMYLLKITDGRKQAVQKVIFE